MYLTIACLAILGAGKEGNAIKPPVRELGLFSDVQIKPGPDEELQAIASEVTLHVYVLLSVSRFISLLQLYYAISGYCKNSPLNGLSPLYPNPRLRAFPRENRAR